MPKPARDGGYTLIEIMVVVGLVSVLATFGVGAWKNWATASAHKGAATELQTIMRQTQVRAVTEGISFCIEFNNPTDTYTVYRYPCGGPTPNVKTNGPFRLGDPKLHLTGVSFTVVAPASPTQVTFRASGSATPGQLNITRSDPAKTYTLTVEGLTGRVSVS